MQILTEFSQRAPDSSATSAQQLIWANAGALQISTTLSLLPTSGNINLVSGTNSYDLLTSFSNFQKLDFNGGVHFYDGSDYIPMKSVTEGWLDSYAPDWRNDSSDKPSAYWKKGDTLYVYPTPNDNYTNGLLVYYFKKPTAMAADGDDPFNDGSTRGDLSNLHEGVVLYMIWKAKQAIGEYDQAERARQEFAAFMREAEVYVNKDEEAINEPFRPYHKPPYYNYSNINRWGVE